MRDADLFFQGLYFKLHGTHQPNSMKKTIIKHQKCISAAGMVLA